MCLNARCTSPALSKSVPPALRIGYLYAPAANPVTVIVDGMQQRADAFAIDGAIGQ